MIVKKLGMVSGGGFPGAGYNERKVAEGVARLMAMENVDAAMRHKVVKFNREVRQILIEKCTVS